MKNVLRVLKRDIMRLVKTPSALVVVLALLVLPSAYTWYNVIGFWNPYENTGNLRVCVVNEDAGGSSELTGELDVGSMIVEQLHENDQLDWVFTDYDTAMSELSAGTSYAVFVIPSDFTSDLLSITTGSFTQPDLHYYVNEKTGPVAPKITDTGATTLDETINSTFVSTVSDVVVKAVDEKVSDAKETLAAARSQATEKLEQAAAGVAEGRTTLGGITQATEQAQGKVGEAREALCAVSDGVAEAAEKLQGVSDSASSLQANISDFSAAAMPLTSQSLILISQASTKAHTSVNSAIAVIGQAQATVSSASEKTQSLIDEAQALDELLISLAAQADEQGIDSSGLASAADALETRIEQAQSLLDSCNALNDTAASVTEAASSAASTLDEAIQAASDAAGPFTAGLFGTTIPELTDELAQISATSANLSSALSSQQALSEQTSLVLDQLTSTLSAARDAVVQTDELLAAVEEDLNSVRTDVAALGGSDAIMRLIGDNKLDAQQIADFMGSPTEVVTEQLYPLNAYGSAMAPLFMNLTFWIGAFMLLVILKQEVDDEGVPGLTITQRYLGRFSLFAIFAAIQAIVCCAGVLVIGIQTVNAPALFFASAVASLTYLSIIYALSVTLQHIGKGICIILVFAQIPGATGLYPVEMTSSFFQTIYPLFPFTYGIGAMREAICGFYGSQYLNDIIVLALFFAAFMALGILIRPLMTNVNRMAARQVKASDLLNGEDVEIPSRPYRFSQILRALSDKEVYRREVYARYERFTRWYPRLIRASVALGIIVPVALVIIFALTPAEKVTLLTVWLVWLAMTFVFLIVVESLRYSFERQLKLNDMTNEELLELQGARNVMASINDENTPHAPSPHGPHGPHGPASEGGCHA